MVTGARRARKRLENVAWCGGELSVGVRRGLASRLIAPPPPESLRRTTIWPPDRPLQSTILDGISPTVLRFLRCAQFPVEAQRRPMPRRQTAVRGRTVDVRRSRYARYRSLRCSRDREGDIDCSGVKDFPGFPILDREFRLLAVEPLAPIPRTLFLLP